MPFPFTWVCELWENLARNRHLRCTSWSKVQHPDVVVIRSWFTKYDGQIQRTGPPAVALLSALFPERRVDRVYNLQEHRLAAVLGRALGLGHSRAAELNQWRQSDGEALAVCVERVMAQCEFIPPDPRRRVTVEEIDAALDHLAALSPFSSPECRAAANSASVDELLTPIVRRLQSYEAKWFVGLLLKSHDGIQLLEAVVQHEFHFMLRDLLAIQNSFKAAVGILGSPSIIALPARPSGAYGRALRSLLTKEVMPELGIMIQRQPYYKARSINHCCQMVNKRRASVERKYDGEYCQIHIDLSNGKQCIRIFSKSGKDSTQDRYGVHQAIKNGLRLGHPDCNIRTRCIVEGELLVWSSRRHVILPFHKIRKYARHGGRRLGCAADSPRRSDENLMVAVYDMLLLDDKVLMSQPHAVRRHYLETSSTTAPGRFILGERQMIDFSLTGATRILRDAFARAISECWEGLVLKPSDEAYHSWTTRTYGIKLKKDYIAGMADSADLCIVGGRRDAKVEKRLNIGALRWTSFHLGCLTNKTDVLRYNKEPKFRIIDELTHHNMPKVDLIDLNQLGRFRSSPFSRDTATSRIEEVRKDLKPPSDVFADPFVVEVLGAGFEKPSDCAFYTLRFPRTTAGTFKLHLDRPITDTIDFAELQLLAHERIEPGADATEDARWISMLLQAEGRSRSTINTSEPPSPSPSLLPSPSTESQLAQSRTIKQQPLHIHDVLEDTSRHSSLCPASISPAAALPKLAWSQPPVQPDSTYSRGLKRARDVLGDLSSFGAKRLNCRVENSDWESRAADGDENHVASPPPLVDDQSVPRVCSLGEVPEIFSNSHHRVRENQNAASTMRISESLVRERAWTIEKLRPSVFDASNARQLLTPPSSREVNGNPGLAAHDCQTVALSGQHIQAEIANSLTRNIPGHVACGGISNHIEDIVGPIWVPPSVSGQDRVWEIVDKDFIAFDLSYTCDLEAFVGSLERIDEICPQPQQAYHMVILDFNQPERAKDDLDSLFQHLLQKSSQKMFASEDLDLHAAEKVETKLWSGAQLMIWDYSLFSRLEGYLRCNPSSRADIDKGSSVEEVNTHRQMLRGAPPHPSPPPPPPPADGISTDRKQRPHPKRVDLQLLTKLCQNSIEDRELFGGFMRIHSRTFREQGRLRYYLARDWKWMKHEEQRSQV